MISKFPLENMSFWEMCIQVLLPIFKWIIWIFLFVSFVWLLSYRSFLYIMYIMAIW